MESNSSAPFVMPIGLPGPSDDVATYYANLRVRLKAQLDGEILRVWVADEDSYSGLCSITKGLITYVPLGGDSPTTAPLDTPMLVLKVWPFSYLDLRKISSVSSALPKLICYGNIDPVATTQMIQQELSTNPRYAALGATERTDLEASFFAGEVSLLLTTGVAIGRSKVDASPAQFGLTGYRRLDLALIDNTGSPLDPVPYFDLLSLRTGPLVSEHPLLAALEPPVVPALAPPEGGNRVRIAGDGFTSGMTVKVGSKPATDVEVATDGKSLYVTMPSAPEGAVDIEITTPGQAPVTLANAITYIGDIVPVTRAVAASYAIQLTEIRDQAQALAAVGKLDVLAHQQLQLKADVAQYLSGELIEARSRAGGGSLHQPSVGAVWEDYQEKLRKLLEEIEASLA